MANVSNFSAVTPGAAVSGTLTDKEVVAPIAPPDGLRADGPRVTFHFAGTWDAGNTYVYYDVVKDNSGASWICKYPQVPKGTPLEEGAYWTRWADPNIEIEEMRQTIQLYNARISKNATDIAKNATDIAKNASNISQNATDIAKNASNISQNTTDIAKNATDIAKNASNISQNAAKIHNLENPIMVVYGDSWSDFTETELNWSNLVAKQLGCARKNYSKSGATITNIGESTIKTLTQEVNESITELSNVSDLVKYVFILMGVNDATHNASLSNILTVLAQQTTIIRNTFPNALISFSFNFPCYNQSKYMPYVNYFKNFAFNRGYNYVDLGSLMFAPSLYKSDRLHPTNGAGTGYIAGRMLGSQCNVVIDDYVIKNDDEGIITIKYTQQGCLLFVTFKGATAKLKLGDMQIKLSGISIGSSKKGPVILTTDVENNYVTAINTSEPESNSTWQGLIYA